MKLPLKDIRCDGGTRPRAAMNDAAVDEYAEDMRRGAVFPPLIVFYDGLNYWLADGFHRCAAAMKLGMKDIGCEVRQGAIRDAQWASFGANKAHGMRRTNTDKVRAVMAAIEHSPQRSDHEIARHVGVSAAMVGKYRPETPSSARRNANSRADVFATRTVTRNGKMYLMQTAKIGRRRQPVSAPAAQPHAVPDSYVAWLTPNNPVAAVRVLWSRCPREYLAAMVEELTDLLRQQDDTHSSRSAS